MKHLKLAIATQTFNNVLEELDNNASIYPDFTSAHEAYGVLLEEVEEVWDHVRKKPHKRNMEELEGELVQVAAMAVKFIWWARNQKEGEE